MNAVASFPVFVDVSGALPLIAGTTDLAMAKARLLLKRAPRISIAAPRDTRALAPELSRDAVDRLDRWPTLDDIRGRPLVIAATGDAGLDTEISALARALGVPVNVPDRPELCTFTLPAIVDRAPVTIAIGTEGRAPVLATELRARLERDLHPRLGRLAAIAGGLRAKVGASLASPSARRAFWQKVFAGPAADAILAGDEAAGRDHIDRALREDATSGAPRKGRVVLVGAGPGDSELLTLKAVRALKSADVVLYDRLVGDGILDMARREALMIPVGKAAGSHSVSQAAIDALIVEHGLAGRTVVRLKGGDPLVFGRAAEEMVAAQAAGLDVEIVPGITAAQGCAAAAGLPLTLRGTVRQFALVTGAASDGEPDLDWESLARPGQAFAVYMGLRTAETIRHGLLAAGADPFAPIVIVENGTRPDQRIIDTRLGDIATAVEVKGVKGPAILLVGLDWRSAGLVRPATVETFTIPIHSPIETRASAAA